MTDDAADRPDRREVIEKVIQALQSPQSGEESSQAEPERDAASTVSAPLPPVPVLDTPVSAEIRPPLAAEQSLVARPATEPVLPDEVSRPASNPPWTLQQYFDGEIDLGLELATCFQNMPVLSTINFRTLGTKSTRGVATLVTSDGGAQVVIDADADTQIVQMSYTFGSMLTLRFNLRELTELNRTGWLELMRREQGGLAFLWGPARWERDYAICISHRYYTNMYAFSPDNFEASVRMTPEVTKKLLDWLEGFWKHPSTDEEPPALLTW